MINKPQIKKISWPLLLQRIRRFVSKLPEDILLRYNVWVQVFLVIVGGIIAAYALLSFTFDDSLEEDVSKEKYVSSVTLSIDKIDTVTEWIEARERRATSSDSVLSNPFFN